HLGNLNGARKTLLLVSEGFEPPVRSRTEDPLPTLETVIRSANQGNVSIYPIDPRAFQIGPAETARAVHDPGAEEAGRSTLTRLATATAGLATLSPADRAQGLQRIAGDSSAFYMITLVVAGLPPGSFQSVQVRVKRPGVVLRARAGFWTTSLDEQ